MPHRRRISIESSVSFEELIKRFLLSKKSQGLAEKTLATYQQHFSAIGRHFDMSIQIDDLHKNELEEMIAHMRDSGLAPNSIKSYTRTLKSFFTWCNQEGITDLNIPLYKAEETIKETYSDKELEALLKKPNLRRCKFTEYRDWVIINLLVNNGCRAATVRNIKIRDLDLDNRVIYLRHTKNKKGVIVLHHSPAGRNISFARRMMSVFKYAIPVFGMICVSQVTEIDNYSLRTEFLLRVQFPISEVFQMLEEIRRQ